MDMYFIALVLPPELDKKVLAFKRWMYERYECKVGLKSPAHITIIPPFWMDPAREENLIADLDKLAATLGQFPIRTANFSAFKPRTIFIAPEESHELNEVKKATDDYFTDANPYGIKLEKRPFHPHITIDTRDLFKKDFWDAWPHFAERKFEEEWNATGISLLKHNKKNWDVFHTSQFQNQVV